MQGRSMTLEEAVTQLRAEGWLIVKDERNGAHVDDEFPDEWCLDGWFIPYPMTEDTVKK